MLQVYVPPELGDKVSLLSSLPYQVGSLPTHASAGRQSVVLLSQLNRVLCIIHRDLPVLAHQVAL